MILSEDIAITDRYKGARVWRDCRNDNLEWFTFKSILFDIVLVHHEQYYALDTIPDLQIFFCKQDATSRKIMKLWYVDRIEVQNN